MQATANTNPSFFCPDSALNVRLMNLKDVNAAELPSLLQNFLGFEQKRLTLTSIHAS
jgi:hypothetical protein